MKMGKRKNNITILKKPGCYKLIEDGDRAFKRNVERFLMRSLYKFQLRMGLTLL